MEKKTAKLIELLELTELRMSVTETESTVFEKIIPTIDIESDKYKTKLEKDEYVRTFFQGRRVIKARSQSMGDRADWYVLAEPDSFNVLEISGRKNKNR